MVKPEPAFCFAPNERDEPKMDCSARAALKAATAALRAAGVPDAAFDARTLLYHVTGRDARVFSAEHLSPAQAACFKALVRRRAAREPLQYLCGSWDFMDFTLAVGPGVLIPRADTEVICETAIAAITSYGASAVFAVDLCSGTGAIAIAMARVAPCARVTAVELSPNAFDYLQKNAAALAPDICCVQADVFAWQQTLAPHSIDVLTANPPYLAAWELETLAPELAFEPRMALEAADDGLAFYRHIAVAYHFALKPGGTLIFEIGSTQAKAVEAILQAEGYTALHIIKDYGGNDRCVTACASCDDFGASDPMPRPFFEKNGVKL